MTKLHLQTTEELVAADRAKKSPRCDRCGDPVPAWTHNNWTFCEACDKILQEPDGSGKETRLCVTNPEALVRRDAEGVLAEHRQNKRRLAVAINALAKAKDKRGLYKLAFHMLAARFLPHWVANGLLNRDIRKLPTYDVLTLSDWIAHFAHAGIAHIPAEIGPEISQGELESGFEILSDNQPLPDWMTKRILPWIEDVQNKGWMWRFEEAAPQTIKEVLGRIRPPEYLTIERVKVPFAIDSRILHCHWDRKANKTRLLARPWVNGQFDAGFPVEIRVFRIKNDKGTGWAACNYYVQRPLPAKYQPMLEKAIALAQQMEDTLQKSPTPGVAFPTGGYSLDFLMLKDGSLTAIEAGPAFSKMGGSHPCCFNLDGVTPGRTLLTPEPGSDMYCPPEVQVYVDRIKAGENPAQLGLPHEAAVQALVFAAVQGDNRAQDFLKSVTRLEGSKES